MRKAFTLIELIIVVVIIGIMALVAVPAFDKYGAKAELANKADEIQIIFERAYRDAVAPRVGANGALVEVFDGAPSRIVYSVGTYTNADCLNGAFTALDSETTLLNEYSKNDYNMPGGQRQFKFCAPGDSDDVVLPGGANATITLTSNAGSKFIDIRKYPYRVMAR